MKLTPNTAIVAVAATVVAADQLSKAALLRYLAPRDEYVVVEGFFKFVHWTNTGAALSWFRGYNDLLALVGLVAIVILYFSRHHFEAHTRIGQASLGLVFGGIVGNLIDRVIHKHVVDFLYFYVERRGGREAGFPAFNIADAAICTGVGLIFLISLRTDSTPPPSRLAAMPTNSSETRPTATTKP